MPLCVMTAYTNRNTQNTITQHPAIVAIPKKTSSQYPPGLNEREQVVTVVCAVIPQRQL